jgi:hypothetical protein
MKILVIIFVILEFIKDMISGFVKNNKTMIKILLLSSAITALVISAIFYMLEPDDSKIKYSYLTKYNLTHDVKCYQTDGGIRTKNFRLYTGQNYTITNVYSDKYDIYTKDGKYGFYLGKCDILNNKNEIINELTETETEKE